MINKQGLAAFEQVDGEEPATARHESATIIRHGSSRQGWRITLNSFALALRRLLLLEHLRK